jgi:hypothetical protein
MKNRALMFALAVFFVSSLAFADNPTDAPLKPNDDYAVLLHPERGDVQKQDVQNQAYQNQDYQNQDAQTSQKRKRSKKNDASVSSKARSENSPKDNRQEEGDPGNPAANGKFAGSN